MWDLRSAPGPTFPMSLGETRRQRVRSGASSGQPWCGLAKITTTKGGRLRYVPMTERLRAALRRHRHLRGPSVLTRPGGLPMTEGALKAVVFRAARKANLRCSGPHMLRHTFCSHLAMRGATARAIQELAGSRSRDDATVHAPQPGSRRGCDSAPRRTISNGARWRHFGDGASSGRRALRS